MVDLPYVDTHQLGVAAPPEVVWAAARSYADGLTGRFFAVDRSDPPTTVALTGRHPFSRYRLDFTVEPDGDQARLSAVTHAAFPGLRGRIYRLLVISSGAHERLTRRMLRSIAARALTRR